MSGPLDTGPPAESPAPAPAPAKSFTLTIPHLKAPKASTRKKVFLALGAAAIAVVVLVVILLIVTFAMLAKLFGEITGKVEGALPPYLCRRWLDRRQRGYMGATAESGDPLYTSCEAAALTVADAESGSSSAPCPPAEADGDSEPDVYAAFRAAQCAGD